MVSPDRLIRLIFSREPVSRVCIRVDAGRKKGLSYGHLMRCLVLESELKKAYGTHALFIVTNIKDGVDYLIRAGKKFVPVPEAQDNEAEASVVLDAIRTFQPDWFIHDLPYDPCNTGYFSRVRKLDTRILFMDDARFITPEADVILNSSILAELNTRKEKGPARYLLGPRFFIFDAGAGVQPPAAGSKRAADLVVSMGGSDPTGLTQKIVDVLFEARDVIRERGISIRVIAGPGFGRTASLRERIGQMGGNTRLIESPDDIYPYFRQAGLVVCAGGRTLYELFTMGIPAFPISSAAHETPVVKAFVDRGYARDGMLHWDPAVFKEKIGTSLIFEG